MGTTKEVIAVPVLLKSGSTTTLTDEVTSGPSCEELFLGLRLGHEGRRVPFKFREEGGLDLEMLCKINLVGRLDGTGMLWKTELTLEQGAVVSINFSTRFRTGRILKVVFVPER